MAETKPYVRIQSNVTISVTCGLDSQDVSNKDAHIPDRLKVNPLWPKATVLIRQGVGIYPSEIVEWNTVKALAKDKVITIGEFLDKPETNEQALARDELKAGLSEIKAINNKSLADIAK